MAEGKNYAAIVGVVQQFKRDGEWQPVISNREVNNQIVREFTIKSITSQKPVRVTLWPEFEEVSVEKGALVSVDGNYTVNTGQNGTQYFNITAIALTVTPPAPRKAREVVNQPTTTSSEQTEKVPF